jgi:hypothetical protein
MLKVVEWIEYFGIKNIMSFSAENSKYFGYLCVNHEKFNLSIVSYGFAELLLILLYQMMIPTK